MFITIYITCAIWGTTCFIKGTQQGGPTTPSSAINYQIMYFAMIFGWVGIVVSAINAS